MSPAHSIALFSFIFVVLYIYIYVTCTCVSIWAQKCKHIIESSFLFCFVFTNQSKVDRTRNLVKFVGQIGLAQIIWLAHEIPIDSLELVMALGGGGGGSCDSWFLMFIFVILWLLTIILYVYVCLEKWVLAS